MASFTDQLVAFNPYIPQLPVDDYVRVGMIKQQQYNEGVQKVQSYIDSVAGLDVIKPEQKEYLQQRVGQLQGEVGKVVSQDFSNQQIVNSVGSLTNKIAGDPIVQNAVLSTQRYKSGLAAIKDAEEKGLNSPSNEYVFQKKVQDWLGDGDAKSSFTGEYEKYTDTKKPILDAINALKPSANITDIPYETDAEGNYITGPDGGRKIAYATIREKMEGVSEARIKQAIEASITPQMKRQFQIDGMYNYRGVDKQGLKSMTDASYNHRLGQVNDIIQGLVAKLNINQNDDNKKDLIQKQIDQYKLGAKDLINQYKQDVEYLDKNPDAYKGDLHYQDEVAKYTLGYSWSKHSLTYENNPVFNGVMKEQEHALNWDKFVEMSKFHQATLNMKREDLRIKEEGLMLKYGVGGQGQGSFKLDTSISEPISQDQLEKVNLSTLQDEVTSMDDDMKAQKIKAVSQLDGGSNWVENVDGTLRYKDQKSKDAAEVAIKTAKEAYDKDPSKVSPAMQTYFSNLSNQDGVVKNYQYTTDKIMGEADKRYGTGNLVKGISPIKISTSNGQSYTYDPKELLDIIEKQARQETKYPLKTHVDPTSGGTYTEPRSAETEELFMKAFNDKEAALVQAYNNGTLDPSAKEGLHKAWERLQSPEARALLRRRDDYIQTEARRAYTQNQGAKFPIVAYKAADQLRAKAAFVNIINDQKEAGKANSNPNFDEDDIAKMLDEKNSKGTTYTLHAQPDGNFSVSFSNTSITHKPREMNITADQAGKWFGTFVNEFKPIQHAINLSKYNGVGNTTDVRNLGRESAYNITPTEQLKNYSVKYHVEEPYDGQYQLKLYIYDKKNKEWLPERYADFGGRMLSQQQIMAAINHLTDAEVDRIRSKGQGSSVIPGSYQGNIGPDPYVDKQGIEGDTGAEEPADTELDADIDIE